MKALLLCSLLLGAAAPGSEPAAATAFGEIDGHYQSIRLALLEDSTAGVVEQARAIESLARALGKAPTAALAGVAPGALEALAALLPEVVQRAGELSKCSELAAQREALKGLSRPLVRWRALVVGPKPRVAYCPMERAAWLQPDGVLGNPYGGTRMPRCGSFVDD